MKRKWAEGRVWCTTPKTKTKTKTKTKRGELNSSVVRWLIKGLIDLPVHGAEPPHPLGDVQLRREPHCRHWIGGTTRSGSEEMDN
eukprot:6481141-Pyramimonas_sp.AAC.1